MLIAHAQLGMVMTCNESTVGAHALVEAVPKLKATIYTHTLKHKHTTAC